MKKAARGDNGSHSAQRLQQIDMLRGVAAMAVAWFHFTATHDQTLGEGLLVASGQYGWLGVQAFFVISGFVIPYAVYRSGRRHPGSFLAQRMARLTPPYWLAIALSIGLVFVSSWLPGYRGQVPDYEVAHVLSNATYLATIVGYDWVNPVFWSLAIEFQYYLLVALSLPFLARLRRYGGWVFAALLLSCLVTPGEWFFAYTPFFAAGFAIFYARYFELASHWLMAALAAAALLTFYRFGPAESAALLVSSGVLMLSGSWHKSLLWLGSISYSLYLVHVPVGGRVMNLAARFESLDSWIWLAPFVAMAVSIAFAWLFWWAIEKPSIRWSRKVGQRMLSRD